MKLGVGNAIRDVELAILGITWHERVIQHHGSVPKRSIEVGCGSGKLSIHLALRGTDATLLDIDQDMVDYSGKLARAAAILTSVDGHDPSSMRCQSIQADGRKLHYKDNEFDLAFNEGVLEHFSWSDQVGMLSEMARVSSRTVAFVVPDAENAENQRISKEVHHHYEGMPAHEIPLTRQNCEQLARESGLRVIAIEPFMDRLLAVYCQKTKSGLIILDQPPPEA